MSRPKRAAAAWIAALLGPMTAPWATAQQVYQQPPDPIARILDAPPTPMVSVSPDRSRLLLLERTNLPTIAEVAAPELALAGVRFDPKTNGPSRSGLSISALAIREIDGDRTIAVETPDGARIGSTAWSSDGRSVAFTVTTDEGVALWVADATTGAARALTPPRLNAAGGGAFAWMPDDRAILCALIPDGRGDAPSKPTTPAGPVVQETEGRAAPNRTYQDLLADPTDELLFEHYFTRQLTLVPLDGDPRPVGLPGLHGTFDPSPDGRFLLVETVHRPFSYLVPASRFPTRIAVWDLDGSIAHTVVDRPLQEEVPIAFDATIAGPRDVSWRADAPATLTWVEALDGGDPAVAADRRDVLRALAAPFEGGPTDLIALASRYSGTTWARDDLALVSERWWKDRSTRTWAINPGDTDAEPRLLFDRSSEDRYNDPGRFVTEVGPLGTRVLLTADGRKSAYLIGDGASPEGNRPFFDRIDLATGETTRLFRSEAPYYESPVAPLDEGATRLLTRRESVDEPPNYFVRDLDGDQLTRLTEFEDPATQLAGLTGEIIRYARADGVELSAKLYLPPGYDPADGPLPFLVWAYPREFKSAAAASQVSGSPFEFTRPSGSSHLFLLTQGYGILDGPAMPIVGAGDAEPNDSYVEQLVASAEAAVEAIVSRGVADRSRIAVGGHSYGAFMAANLLAHSDLFAAGIARSGAYNRTLTPFGFQSEERSFWEAPEVYMAMSPFAFAHEVDEPILLIHGQADNNSGTFPIQSERFFAALKGRGATTRLVLLPAESHGYRARESVGHTLWEMVRWLDRHLGRSSESHETPPAGADAGAGVTGDN